MPKSLAPLLQIAQMGIPFTAADGRAFVRLGVPSSGGFFILPVRSPAFRDWFFHQFFSQFDALPSTPAFHAILNHLEAQATQDDLNHRLSVFHRVGSRGHTLMPDQILLATRRRWTGSATQLLTLLAPSFSCGAPQNLSRQLSRSTPELAEYGIKVEFRRRHKGARIIELRQNPGDDPP